MASKLMSVLWECGINCQPVEPLEGGGLGTQPCGSSILRLGLENGQAFGPRFSVAQRQLDQLLCLSRRSGFNIQTLPIQP